jgi:hypothetical protein
MNFLDRVEQLLPFLEESEKSLTSDISIDSLRASQSSLLYSLGGMNPELMVQGMSEYTALMNEFKAKLVSLVADTQSGVLSKEQSYSRWAELTDSYYKQMFEAGAKAAGNPYYQSFGITKKDEEFIKGAREEEGQYFGSFLDDIESGAGKIDYATRAKFYADSAGSQFFNGQIAGHGDNIIIHWVMDPLAEHCSTCPMMAVKTYTWKTLPFVPRSGFDTTECGSNCRCHLEYSPAAEGVGIPTTPGRGTEQALKTPGRNAEIYTADGKQMHGELEKQVDDIYAQMYKARQMIDIAPTAEEKAYWILNRRELNKSLISLTGNYRVLPTISVKDLTKTIKSAADLGYFLTTKAKLDIGQEILLVRGSYATYGIVDFMRNELAVKTATGMNIPIDDRIDILFSLKKTVVPTAEQLVEIGTSASGNYGHDGRDGEVGGSALSRKLLYHGTIDQCVQDIMKNGLVPQGGKGADSGAVGSSTLAGTYAAKAVGHTYFTQDKRAAGLFAGYASKANPGSKAVVLEIRIAKSYANMLEKDPNTKGQNLSSLRLQGAIPPGAFKIVRVYDKIKFGDVNWWEHIVVEQSQVEETASEDFSVTVFLGLAVEDKIHEHKQLPLNTKLVKLLLGNDEQLFEVWMNLYEEFVANDSAIPIDRAWISFKELYQHNRISDVWTLKDQPITEIGTSQSGNYGHKGRKDIRGGSAKEGETQSSTEKLAISPQSYILRRGNLKTPDESEAEFNRSMRKQYPDGQVPLFHESTIKALESIRKNGIKIGDAGIFATVGKPGGFVTAKDKIIVAFDAEYDDLTPDMRYYDQPDDPEDPFASLLKEHKGIFGADVSYNRDQVSARDIKYIAVVKDGKVVVRYYYPFTDSQLVRETLHEIGTSASGFHDHKGGVGGEGNPGGSQSDASATDSSKDITDPKDPNQTHYLGNFGRNPDEHIPLTVFLLKNYISSSTNDTTLNDVASKEYSLNAVDQAMKTISPVDLEVVARRLSERDPENLNKAFLYPSEKYFDQAKESLRKEFEARFAERFNEDYFNPKAINTSVEKLRKEAGEYSTEGLQLYRGIKLDKSLLEKINKEIEEKGFYDFNVMPVSSYTEKRELANKFALYGEGGRSPGSMSGGGGGARMRGCVYSILTHKEDVWLHYKQKTWKELSKKEPIKFHIGGKTQYEIVHGHPKGFVRLTKDNFWNWE